ncbi:MAG: type II toxin-antitoxin system Phd/YefM family antitoxin [Acidobacteria bacterium]|nr:type II toxin-antitoxin system Phd/YefM family antitoxin [Acidobacteriota bacterium]
MASRYSIAQARAKLPAVVNQAASGMHVELTRRGQPVAVILSTQEFERLRGKQQHFRHVYQQFLDKYNLSEVGLDPDFASSLRDRNPGRKVDL